MHSADKTPRIRRLLWQTNEETYRVFLRQELRRAYKIGRAL